MEGREVMPQSKSQPRIIALSVSLYRWLLRLGPKKFLQEYEEIMLLDFRQHCRNAYAQGGICSVLRLWPFFISAIVDMSVEQFYESKRKIRLLLKGKQIKLNER